MKWHIVHNEHNVIVGVSGENFLSDAQELASKLERETGLPHFLNMVQSDSRPTIGSLFVGKKL